MEALKDREARKNRVERLEDPPVARALFGEIRWAWLWLILRVILGWEWLTHGVDKLSNPAWIGPNAGAAVNGFIQGALAQTTGERPQVQGWYAWFLENIVQPNAALWSYLVVIGEILVGIALILGLFTGIAAFFGAFMNASYLLAGTVGVNPVLFAMALLLVLAWKTAGWWGLDRWVLPALGTPWSPGLIFKRRPEREKALERPSVRPGEAIPSTGAKSFDSDGDSEKEVR